MRTAGAHDGDQRTDGARPLRGSVLRTPPTPPTTRIQPSTRGIDPERRVSHPIGISHMNMNRPAVFQVAALRSYNVRASLADVGPPRRATWSAVAENTLAMSTTTQFTSPNAINVAAP